MVLSDYSKSQKSGYFWREGGEGLLQKLMKSYLLTWVVAVSGFCPIIIHHVIHCFVWFSVSVFDFIIKSFLKKILVCCCLGKTELFKNKVK